jgi:hypothetical protein
VQQSEIKLFIGGHNADVPLIKNTDVSYKNYLLKAGFIFCTDINEADAALFIEMDESKLTKLVRDIPVMLIRNEPEVVWPTNYRKNFIRRVHKIIDVGQYSYAENKFSPWPQDWSQIEDSKTATSSKSSKIALINGNKISFIPGELYSLRRKCIHEIEEIDLYGVGWEVSNFRKLLILGAEIVLALRNGFWPKLSRAIFWFTEVKNYVGTPDSKFRVLAKYKYTLVIENSQNYMTEKLFDAFLAGSIPIYVGPDVELFGIPKRFVVQVRPSLSEINSGIKLAKELNYEAWKGELDTWLADPEVRKIWDAEQVFPRVIEDITEFLNSSF